MEKKQIHFWKKRAVHILFLWKHEVTRSINYYIKILQDENEESSGFIAAYFDTLTVIYLVSGGTALCIALPLPQGAQGLFVSGVKMVSNSTCFKHFPKYVLFM